MSTTSDSIPLYLASQKAYIWDPQHAATLRVTHHIGALATGTLPGVAQQNVFLGLPLVVMPEEAVLLIENVVTLTFHSWTAGLGICHFINVPHAYRPPTAQEISAHTSARLEMVHDLQAAALEASEEKKRVFERSRAEGGAGAGKGKRGKGKEGVRATTITEKEEAATDSLFAPPTPRQPPPHAATTTSQAYFSSITSHPHPFTHPWFNPSLPSAIYTSLSLAQQAGVWTYPSTPLERARCAVYRRLWEEGMFMGQGVKFGGEFLVYPGDPLRYHSHFVTTTLPTLSTPIRPLELVAWGRLGTATKKAHLLCCVDMEGASSVSVSAPAASAEEDEREKGQEGGDEKRSRQQQQQVEVIGKGESKPHVQFYSLEWANFG
ncbi:hypothetical protein QFC21_000563 [Naganishia friedmannii]|uniref:Uncharacterized protein n=1 Tax=Naganishia friedmannii TaxID=89922 RepID=A0ACC2WDE9_9TREE|nr:hypothetical protein QFC21_000563 [Naganishia friedmannii]